MPKVITIMSRCAVCRPSAHTFRQLIALRSAKTYRHCLKQLRAAGIKPFKAVSSSRILGLHIDRRTAWKMLAKHPLIKFLEKDFKIRAHGVSVTRTKRVRKRSVPLLNPAAASAIISWNIKRIKAPAAWNTTRGKTIKVAVIDTGIAAHSDLVIAGGINTINGGSYADDNGHGTHVAGIVAATGASGKLAGTAPKAELYAVKALDRNGEGYVSDIVEGIDWCIQHKMKIINMSFGLLSSGSSRILHDAVKRAVNKGIVVVASAGNSGSSSGKLEEPAAFSETISVAASTRSDQIASFSSRGSGISITAPGENITSTWLNGKYKAMSGTSMASPHVAGGAALLLAGRSGLSPAAVKSRLRQLALPLNGYNSLSQGAGLMQLDRIFEN